MVLTRIPRLLRKRAETTFHRDNTKPTPLEAALLLYRFYDPSYFKAVSGALAEGKISPN